jgi:hypothetical protein
MMIGNLSVCLREFDGWYVLKYFLFKDELK